MLNMLGGHLFETWVLERLLCNYLKLMQILKSPDMIYSKLMYTYTYVDTIDQCCVVTIMHCVLLLIPNFNITPLGSFWLLQNHALISCFRYLLNTYTWLRLFNALFSFESWKKYKTVILTFAHTSMSTTLKLLLVLQT